jgi:hypothetical protein
MNLGIATRDRSLGTKNMTKNNEKIIVNLLTFSKSSMKNKKSSNAKTDMFYCGKYGKTIINSKIYISYIYQLAS